MTPREESPLEPQLPQVGEVLDLGLAWVIVRVLPEPRIKQGKRYIGVFCLSRATSEIQHHFMFSETATRAAVHVLWDHALAVLGVRDAVTVGARAMLQSDRARRYRAGCDMHFYGHRCRVLGVAVASEFRVVLRVAHPETGELRLVVDSEDHVLEWAPVEDEREACA